MLPDIGGRPIDHPEMIEGFSIEYKNFKKAADSADGPIHALTKARSRLSGCELPSNAFGDSHQAQAVAKYWNEALDQRLKELRVCVEEIEDLAERLKRTMKHYMQADWQSRAAVKSGTGGAAGALKVNPDAMM